MLNMVTVVECLDYVGRRLIHLQTDLSIVELVFTPCWGRSRVLFGSRVPFHKD